MQITINTDTDDLPAVIRMLQAYAPPRKLRMTNEATGETIAEFTPSSVKITNDPIDITDDKLKAAVLPPCSAPAQEDDEPSPEHVFTTVENNVGQAGGSGGNGQPPESLFDAPLPPCDQTEKVGEATSAPRTAIDDVTVDAAGLPWDERIHSGAKSKLANGNWKLRRGVDPALVASVEAELRGDPKPAEPATAPETSTVTPASVVVPPVSAPAPPPPPAPAPVAAPPTPPAPATPKPITNAAELVAAVMDKRFTTDQVNAACRAVGVDNVASLLAKQDKLPEVLRHLGVPT